jgi:hypothetical protein
MKTIVVPLDFSDESYTGLDLSVMLAVKSEQISKWFML